tara:strand:- start:2079 stop:2873 length:795 start_codon:yes stop_codon:yes gene_type:complete
VGSNGDDKAREEVQRVLGEPLIQEYSENSLRIRRNLLIISVIAIVYGWGELKVAPDSSLFGVKFESVDPIEITWLITGLLTYHLVHFVWSSISHIQAWRIRITGTKLAFITAGTFTSELGDYPSDARQSSLYFWWLKQANRIGDIRAPLAKIHSELKDWSAEILDAVEKAEPENKNLHNEIVGKNKRLTSVQDDITKLKLQIENVEKTVTSARVPASLERFDAWFGLFQITDLARWFLLEFLFPVALGLVGLGFLIGRIYETSM